MMGEGGGGRGWGGGGGGIIKYFNMSPAEKF